MKTFLTKELEDDLKLYNIKPFENRTRRVVIYNNDECFGEIIQALRLNKSDYPNGIVLAVIGTKKNKR